MSAKQLELPVPPSAAGEARGQPVAEPHEGHEGEPPKALPPNPGRMSSKLLKEFQQVRLCDTSTPPYHPAWLPLSSTPFTASPLHLSAS